MIKLSLYVHKTECLLCIAETIRKTPILLIALALSASGCAAPGPTYSPTAYGETDTYTHCSAEPDALRLQLQRENFIYLSEIEYQQRLIRSLEQEIRGMQSQDTEAVRFSQPQATAVLGNDNDSLVWVRPVILQVALSTIRGALRGVLGKQKWR